MAWHDARLLAHAAPAPIGATLVSLRQAAGLTLAEDLRARGPIPGFDTAAMDGYAISGAGPYRLRAKITAGHPWHGLLQRGEAAEISTGAAIPAGATSVLRVEDVTVEGTVIFGREPAAGTHIRPAGDDAPGGAVVALAGTSVGPAMLGLAASCGQDNLIVTPRPRVQVIVTGDEVIHVGPAGNGLVRDALGPMLPALVAELGGEVTAVTFLPDGPAERLEMAIRRAAAGDTSVVVVTGSTSVGRTDHLRQVLVRLGDWVVDTVACRPGHPQCLGGLGDGRWLVGLPGNPFAAFVAAHTLLAPLLAGLTGRPLARLRTAQIAGNPAYRSSGYTRLLPVSCDGRSAHVVDGHGSAFLGGAALCDALAVIPPQWRSGQAVPLLLT